MAKFTIGELGFVPVPTNFIKKDLFSSPEQYIRLYLYGLCLASTGVAPDDAELVDTLHMTSEQIEDGLRYWQGKGLVRKVGTKYEYVFGEQLQEPSRRRAPLYADQNFNNILTTIFGRELTPSDLSKIYDYTDIFGLPQDVVISMIEYCVSNKGNRVSIAYLDKVAQSWAEEGIVTVKAAAEKIEEYRATTGGANKLMRLMGLHGKYPGQTELEFYTKWTEKLGFTHDAIEYAMRGKEFSGSQPFKYLDAILINLHEAGATTARKINEYYTEYKDREENIKKILQALDYSRASITPVRERFYESWRKEGYSMQMILQACVHSLSMGSRKFETVDALLKEWRVQGLGNETEIAQYLQKQNTLDEKVKQVYECMGISKPVGDPDRRSYLQYTQECKMAHEVLLFAAEISSLKERPLDFMHRVLGRWAQDGITTLAMAQQQNLTKLMSSDKAEQKAYPQRVYSEEEKQKMDEHAMRELEELYGE